MLRNLRFIDGETVEAEGPRFDLERVLPAAVGVVDTIMNRAAMRDPLIHALFATPGQNWSRYDETTGSSIAAGFRAAARMDHIADEFYYAIHRPPLYVCLALLGYETLYRINGNPMTSMGRPWGDLDLTPRIVIAPIDPDGWIRQRDDKLLMSVLGSAPQDVEVQRVTDDHYRLNRINVVFPHAVFGAGEGTLRLPVFVDNDEVLP